MKRRNASAQMESAVSNIIEVTDKAQAKLKELQHEVLPALRIAVVGGGCSGLSYKLEWCDPKEGDRSFMAGETLIVVDSKSALFLSGMTLDYSDGLNGTGFVFSNPNAKRSCGCGSSFSV